INERRQADQGAGNMGHLTVSSPALTTTVTSLAEDGSSFGLKLGAVTSSLTGATVTLTATTTNPPPTGSFLIGADTDATTTNLQAALTSSVKTLSDTALVAASAIAASNN